MKTVQHRTGLDEDEEQPGQQQEGLAGQQQQLQQPATSPSKPPVSKAAAFLQDASDEEDGDDEVPERIKGQESKGQMVQRHKKVGVVLVQLSHCQLCSPLHLHSSGHTHGYTQVCMNKLGAGAEGCEGAGETPRQERQG
jgi:hypothetical protein